MYWNERYEELLDAETRINYNMRCIETFHDKDDFEILVEINYNMRCIETVLKEGSIWLALMDKLQHEMYWNMSIFPSAADCKSINYNMRCIETT